MRLLLVLVLQMLLLGAVVAIAIHSGAMIGVNFTDEYLFSIFTTPCPYHWYAVRRNFEGHWAYENDKIPCDITVNEIRQRRESK